MALVELNASRSMSSRLNFASFYKKNKKPAQVSTPSTKRSCEHEGCNEKGSFRAPYSRTELQKFRWFCEVHVREYNLRWNYYAGMSDEEVEADRRRDITWQRPTWPLGGNGRAYGRFQKGQWQQKTSHTASPGQEDAGFSRQKAPEEEVERNKFHKASTSTQGSCHQNRTSTEDHLYSSAFFRKSSFSSEDILSYIENGFNGGDGDVEASEDAFWCSPHSAEGQALKVLGLTSPVAPDQIKSTYKDLAKRYHPDRNKGCRHAEDKIKKINQAYHTLKMILKSG